MPQSLHTAQTPATANASDGTPGITTAVTLVFGVPGQITHVGFYATTTTGGVYTCAVWQVTANDVGSGGAGTLLESKVAGAVTPGAWNWVELDDPVVITPDTVAYRVGTHNSQGRYVYTNNAFTSAPGIVNGDITAPENQANPVALGAIAQGTYLIDAALQYPRSVGSAADYFADVVFVPDDEEPETTPVSKSWVLPWTVRAAVSRSWVLPWTVRAAATRSWVLPWHVRGAVTRSWVLRWQVGDSQLSGLALARSVIRDALASVGGVTAFAERPRVIAVGAAWPYWRGLVRSFGATGLLISEWEVYVVVGKTEQDATDYVDARAAELADALQPAGWTTGVRPYRIDTDQGALFAVSITLTRE